MADRVKRRRGKAKTGGGRRGKGRDGSAELYRKQILGTLLGLRGEVTMEHEIVQRKLRADILFVPVPGPRDEDLGPLDRMAAEGECVIEIYSQTPGAQKGWDCLAKHSSMRGRAGNHAGKHKLRPPARHLWIISPGHPRTLIREMGMTEMAGWPAGFWEMQGRVQMHLVAVRLLPVTRDTLYLRLLGRGKVLAEALRELESISRRSRVRRELGDVVLAWHDEIVETTDKDQEIMLLAQTKERIEELKSRSYKAGRLDGREEGREEGREGGIGEGERLFFLKMLALRFGPLPEAMQKRVERAKDASLQRWAERLLSARTLNDVFKR